ncbi:hypothetical protein CASFOL_033999 [Castilleja foliolosa]|uniref:S-protein homolog n=1 Tax=Castilleja foliolosa TaxID=1961234 RepID=A0ABD3BYJ4_9LAMI
MKTIALLIILASTTLILFTHPLYHFDNTTYDVRVINGFSNNSSEPLVVWCVSSDKGGIGGRALQEGDDYSWTVESRNLFYYWSSSRFVCTVKWGGKRKRFEAFRDRYRCGARRQCLWLVKEDGFYFGNDEFNWVRHFSWI